MNRFVVRCVLAACMCACVCAAPHRVPRTAPYCLNDAATQIPVVKYTLPGGWAATGRVNWNAANPQNLAVYEIMVSDTQNGGHATFFSSIQFVFRAGRAQVPELMEASRLAQRLSAGIWNRLKPERNHLVEARFTPETPDGFDQRIAQARADNRYLYGMQALRFEAVFEYVKDGKTQRLRLAGNLIVGDCRTANAPFTTVAIESLVCSSAPVADEAAFLSALDGALKTRVENPKWTQTIAYLTQSLARERNLSAAQAQANLERDRAEIRGLQLSVYKNRKTASDTAMKLWGEAIREVSVVPSPWDGGELVISNLHHFAWVNAANEVIYSNRTDFDPSADPYYSAADWKRVR